MGNLLLQNHAIQRSFCMESMQDVHDSAPSAIRLERADLGLVLAVAESGGVTRAGSLLHLEQRIMLTVLLLLSLSVHLLMQIDPLVLGHSIRPWSGILRSPVYHLGTDCSEILHL